MVIVVVVVEDVLRGFRSIDGVIISIVSMILSSVRLPTLTSIFLKSISVTLLVNVTFFVTKSV